MKTSRISDHRLLRLISHGCVCFHFKNDSVNDSSRVICHLLVPPPLPDRFLLCETNFRPPTHLQLVRCFPFCRHVIEIMPMCERIFQFSMYMFRVYDWSLATTINAPYLPFPLRNPLWNQHHSVNKSNVECKTFQSVYL